MLDGHKGEGGASRRSGGRDERPPQLSGPSDSYNTPKNRWIPPSSKRDVHSSDDKNDLVFRKVRGILNKLTPEKFDKLSLELLNVGIDSQLILKGIILLIFEKALDEPKYSSLYAQLCHRLCEDAPNFELLSSNTSTFRRLLLNKCRDEFENRSRATDAYDKKDGPLSDEETEQYHLAKQKMLGNIKFIGELGKLEMLHEGILHKCIKQLLEKKKNVSLKDMAEDLECLCQIIRTVGRRLDTSKAKAWMDQYFERIKNFTSNMELPSRIRFMLQDVMELRENKWVPRKVLSDHGPKTISQIRLEAADEFGVYIAPLVRGCLYGNRPMNGNMGPQQRAGLGDLFSVSPTEIISSIGTGPGVIQMDNYSHAFSMNSRQRGGQQNQGYQTQYSSRRQDGGSPRSVRYGNVQSQQPFQSSQVASQQLMMQQQRQASGGSRDLPPRFMKISNIQSGSGGEKSSSIGSDEISLRPAKNFAVFRPVVPNPLSKPSRPAAASLPHFQSTPATDVGGVTTANPLLSKQAAITIKQVSQEKNKASKKTVLSKEEIDNAMSNLMKDYLNIGEEKETVGAFKDLCVPKKFIADILSQMMKNAIQKSDSEKEKTMALISALKCETLILSDQFIEAFKILLNQLPGLESDVPLIKSYVASFAAQAVAGNVISLAELAEPLENGAHYPLFLLCLQQMHKLKSKDWLVNIFNESKIDLLNMLSEIDQNKDRMMEILEDRSLGFLFPLLRIQTELWKQIQTDPSATAICKWIREKVSNELHSSLGFINILATSLDPAIAPEKCMMEKERELLDKLKGVLQRFLHNHIDLQVSALYAAQVFCYNHHFPKNMLLRFFMHFYDMEIAEEEAFMKWKEEVNDEYPGKGKALFQVNQWLTWLEQAEEESEEEEEEEEEDD